MRVRSAMDQTATVPSDPPESTCPLSAPTYGQDILVYEIFIILVMVKKHLVVLSTNYLANPDFEGERRPFRSVV